MRMLAEGLPSMPGLLSLCWGAPGVQILSAQALCPDGTSLGYSASGTLDAGQIVCPQPEACQDRVFLPQVPLAHLGCEICLSPQQCHEDTFWTVASSELSTASSRQTRRANTTNHGFTGRCRAGHFPSGSRGPFFGPAPSGAQSPALEGREAQAGETHTWSQNCNIGPRASQKKSRRGNVLVWVGMLTRLKDATTSIVGHRHPWFPSMTCSTLACELFGPQPFAV